MRRSMEPQGIEAERKEMPHQVFCYRTGGKIEKLELKDMKENEDRLPDS